MAKQNEDNGYLWGALGIALLLLLFEVYREMNNKPKPVNSNMTLVPTSAGAFNNPGNIRYSNDVFAGEIESTSCCFKSFESEAYGYRAIMKILRTYYNLGFKNIADMMSRYSPVGDGNNDPSVKAASVQQITGINMYQDLGTILYNNQVKLLAGAIAFTEQKAGFVINSAAIDEGYNLL